jgi:hypothetical protein
MERIAFIQAGSQPARCHSEWLLLVRDTRNFVIEKISQTGEEYAIDLTRGCNVGIP